LFAFYPGTLNVALLILCFVLDARCHEAAQDDGYYVLSHTY
jgi:hypothetical protein